MTARHLGAMTHGPVDILQKHGDKYIVSTEAVPLLYGYLSFNVSFYLRIFNYCFKMNCGQERREGWQNPKDLYYSKHNV